MVNRTKIEWVKNPDGTQGYTWNPITGCLNHTPEGLCLGGMFPCYAYKLANGRLRSRYLANKNWDTRTPAGYEGYPNLDPFYPRFWEDRTIDPGLIQKPKGIFVCDMGELFGAWIPEHWQTEIFYRIKRCPQHRFYLLTKQPQNLIKFSPFPDNCWVGVTATGYDASNKALDCLKVIEAKVKYISVEPMLEAIPLNSERLSYCGINQVIIGAQTKPYKPPKIEWIEEMVEACDMAGVPVFLKDNLTKMCWDAPNKRWRLGFTRNYNLERDLRTVCARLGYRLTLNLSSVPYNDKRNPTFRGELRFERSGHWNEKPMSEIVTIRKSRCREVYDIGVEDEPHLLSLASGVLTHNSKPNPMPESVTDRPTESHEYILMLTKSGTSQYWTHRDHEGSRTQPKPDYRWQRHGKPDMKAIQKEIGGMSQISVWVRLLALKL